MQSGFPSSSRGRSSSTSQTVGEDDEEEGLIKPGSRKPKGETYACEKCNKVSLQLHRRAEGIVVALRGSGRGSSDS